MRCRADRNSETSSLQSRLMVRISARIMYLDMSSLLFSTATYIILRHSRFLAIPVVLLQAAVPIPLWEFDFLVFALASKYELISEEGRSAIRDIFGEVGESF